jgi:hypothetical protein
MEWLCIAGWLTLRLGVGLLFLNAAWACGKNTAARKWTEIETAILVPPPYAKLCSLIGIMTMGLGGTSVLFGLYGELGGLMLAGFLVPGAMIHFRKMKEVDALVAQLRPPASVPAPAVAPTPPADAPLGPLDVLAVSARLGHYSSALKNLALVGVMLLIAAVGTGPWSLLRLWTRNAC